MRNVKLVWATPDGDRLIAYMARVSNPDNQNNPDTSKLISYCIEHKHWSILEMASMCVEVNTTRDIGRQILRHRSFSFQEFCVAGNTNITLELPGAAAKGKRSAYTRTIEHLYRLQEEGKKLPSGVRVYDEGSKTFVRVGIKEVFQTGVKPLFRVTLANGKSIDSTREHKFMTGSGWQTLEDAVGLTLVGNRAAFTKQVAFACNGVPAHTSREWLSWAKAESIANGGGLSWIATQAGRTTHTIRKWLARHGLQFTRSEVASYTPVWNKGLRGYSLPKHSMETIRKMRASARKGAASNLWRGGASRSERLRIADWCAAHRTEFLKAANYRCADCGSSTRLELHHVKPVASHPELARVKENIQVLCKGCHDNLHGLAGHRRSWRQKSRGNTLTVHWSEVQSVEYLGEQMTYDMEVNHESHNYVANGIVTHNSQRYQDASKLPPVELRQCRMQDTKNRQNSLEDAPEGVARWWDETQQGVHSVASAAYRQALEAGIAKEQARALLPEGLTPSRMYITGTLRSWIHYIDLRTDASTQKEHRQIAEACKALVAEQFPGVAAAVWRDAV